MWLEDRVCGGVCEKAGIKDKDCKTYHKIWTLRAMRSLLKVKLGERKGIFCVLERSLWLLCQEWARGVQNYMPGDELGGLISRLKRVSVLEIKGSKQSRFSNQLNISGVETREMTLGCQVSGTSK